MFKKLSEVESRYEQVQQSLAEPGITNNQKKFRQLAEELSNLKPLVTSYKKYKDIERELLSNRKLFQTDPDEEIRAMAKEEIHSLELSKENSD